MTPTTKSREVASKTARLTADLTNEVIRELSDEDIETLAVAGGAGMLEDPLGRT